MIGGNFRLAWESIQKSKFRNLLTTLGIIIGVAAVVTTVSVGEGFKRQIQGQIKDFGQDLIIVRPGQAGRNVTGNKTADSLFPASSAGSLTDLDLNTIVDTAGVRFAAPISFVPGSPSFDGKEFASGSVIATTSNLPELTNQKVAFGQFLSDADEGGKFVVIGKTVAEDLFNQNVPIGRSIDFRGEKLIVKGVFEEFKSNPFTIGIDFNTAIFVPSSTGKALSQNSSQISQILVKPTDINQAQNVKQAIERNVYAARGGQKDILVLSQDDTLALTNNIVIIVTGLVTVMAGISLIVGGVGIMNIMIASVTERTQEIGIRKAIGATNRQILNQFLFEALLLSIFGSIFGLVIAGCISLALYVLTDLSPFIPWQVVLIAVGASVGSGILFGVAPAVKAARKDPIQALRNE